MRKNEYNSIDEFLSQYTGKWNPSEGKWLGLEFKFKGKYFRFHTDDLSEAETNSSTGEKKKVFFVYEIICEEEDYPGFDEYRLIGSYSDMNEVLENCRIGDEFFRNIIMFDETEILGQD